MDINSLQNMHPRKERMDIQNAQMVALSTPPLLLFFFLSLMPPEQKIASSFSIVPPLLLKQQSQLHTTTNSKTSSYHPHHQCCVYILQIDFCSYKRYCVCVYGFVLMKRSYLNKNNCMSVFYAWCIYKTIFLTFTFHAMFK
mmetsp:Transcript_8/g.16  ORF Transcript_8/g.16 Transcript_8/m.16 type:complete len:141 (-) Transcript_8:44-466(-)